MNLMQNKLSLSYAGIIRTGSSSSRHQICLVSAGPTQHPVVGSYYIAMFGKSQGSLSAKKSFTNL